MRRNFGRVELRKSRFPPKNIPLWVSLAGKRSRFRSSSAACQGRTLRPGEQGAARRVDTKYRGCAFCNAMKGGEHGKARKQGRSDDGRGIREATVRRFVAEGASVAFCDRDGEHGQGVAAELKTAGAKNSLSRRLTLVPRPHASPSSTVPRRSSGASTSSSTMPASVNTRRSTRRARRVGTRSSPST